MSDASSWRGAPVGQILSELTRLNRGDLPRSFEECCQVAQALNWKIAVLPDCECPVAHIDRSRHVIFVPALEDRDRFRVAIHELSELISSKEGGEPQFNFIGPEEEHHRVAELLVECLDEKLAEDRCALSERVARTEAAVHDLRVEIANMTAELLAFVEAASAGADTHGMRLPERIDLQRAAADLARQMEYLECLRARLRCI